MKIFDTKQAKANVALDHAQRAREEGRTILVYRQNVGALAGGFSGPVQAAAEVIESIEGAGWRLEHFTYDEEQSRHGALLLIFRRAGLAA